MGSLQCTLNILFLSEDAFVDLRRELQRKGETDIPSIGSPLKWL